MHAALELPDGLHDGAGEEDREYEEDDADNGHAHEDVVKELIERRREGIARLAHDDHPVLPGGLGVAGDLGTAGHPGSVADIAALAPFRESVRKDGLVHRLDLLPPESLVRDDLVDHLLLEGHEAG